MPVKPGLAELLATPLRSTCSPDPPLIPGAFPVSSGAVLAEHCLSLADTPTMTSFYDAATNLSKTPSGGGGAERLP